MTYQLSIVDDDLKDLNTIYQLIHDFILAKSLDIHIHKYCDIDDFPMDKPVDILFLDIDMPNKSGFELAKAYKKIHKHTLIIFVTNHHELVYKACNIHPFDFIRKENLKVEIPTALEEALYKLLEMYPTATFYINGNAYILRKDAITYCESFNHNTVIHFNHTSITVNQQLHEVFKTINSNDFKRVGRSYLVNMRKVKKLEGTTLFIDQDNQVPISRRKKKMVLEYLKEAMDNVDGY